MKNILFTHSYFLRFDPKQWKNAQPYAPLGTLFAAAFMRQEGYQVSVHDIQFARGPEEIKTSLEKRPDYFVVYKIIRPFLQACFYFFRSPCKLDVMYGNLITLLPHKSCSE